MKDPQLTKEGLGKQILDPFTQCTNCQKLCHSTKGDYFSTEPKRLLQFTRVPFVSVILQWKITQESCSVWTEGVRFTKGLRVHSLLENPIIVRERGTIERRLVPSPRRPSLLLNPQLELSLCPVVTVDLTVSVSKQVNVL